MPLLVLVGGPRNSTDLPNVSHGRAHRVVMAPNERSSRYRHGAMALDARSYKAFAQYGRAGGGSAHCQVGWSETR